MDIAKATKVVDGQLALVEMRNVGKELRPWCRDSVKDAPLHWGLTQKRLALESGDLAAACLAGMNVARERTEAQRAAAAQNGARLASRQGSDNGSFAPGL